MPRKKSEISVAAKRRRIKARAARKKAKPIKIVATFPKPGRTAQKYPVHGFDQASPQSANQDESHLNALVYYGSAESVLKTCKEDPGWAAGAIFHLREQSNNHRGEANTASYEAMNNQAKADAAQKQLDKTTELLKRASAALALLTSPDLDNT